MGTLDIKKIQNYISKPAPQIKYKVYNVCVFVHISLTNFGR